MFTENPKYDKTFHEIVANLKCPLLLKDDNTEF